MTQTCYHCDLENPLNENYQLTVLGKPRTFCCPGCLAIAQTICDTNLEDFYRFRTEKNLNLESQLEQDLIDIVELDTPSVLDAISDENDRTDTKTRTIELGIEGITCAACGWLIKKKIAQREDVIDIQVNISTRRALLKIERKAKLSPILKQIRQLGYRAFPFSESEQEQAIQNENKLYIKRLVIAGLAMTQVMMYAVGFYIGEFQDISKEHAYFLHLISGVVTTPVVLYSAMPFFQSAWRSLLQWHFGMNLPVSIAIFAGYSASMYSLMTHAEVYYFDSVVMFTFFLLVGRFLEHRMRLKAVLKQQNFNRLIPISATRKNKDGSISTLLVNDINVGDHLIINAGAVVPVDGTLLDKSAELNEAVLTGEFMPVKKFDNDPIVSGSTNNASGFIMRATSTLETSHLQQLIDLQDCSENLTTDKVSFADKVASWYVVTLLLLCFITGSIWWFVEPDRIFPVVLSLLVVSCPCALSLATPAAVAAAISQLTDRGLMIKGKSTLSNLSQITEVVFDKTGTLTYGEMALTGVDTYSELSEAQCLEIAVSMESISSHPLAIALGHQNVNRIPNIESQEVISGGVTATIDGKEYRLGSERFTGVDAKTVIVENDSETGKSTTVTAYLSEDNELIASFNFADQINDTAKITISSLKHARYSLSLLSGDSAYACKGIAKELNLTNVISQSTPQSKLNFILDLEQNGKKTLMIGDGVNDIGALKQASVSIAMGTASQLSQSTSSAVLVSRDLNVIAEALQLSKKLNRVIKQNIGWAVVYNLTAIPFAVMGLVPAWLAAIGMTSSSLIVVLNALRLRS